MNLFNKFDKNSCTDAIFKARAGGSAVPKKVTGKYIYTLDAINKANSIQRSNDILIIHDFDSPGHAEIIISQLLTLQNDKQFTEGLGYIQDLYFDLYNEKDRPDGNIYKQAIFELKDNISIKTETDVYYYDGSDLNVQKYGVVILFTRIVPVIQSNSFGVMPILTTIFGDTYHAVTDSNNIPNRTVVRNDTGNITITYTSSINQYHPNFGPNLQNYINSGGNVILGNNIWQNIKIPGFQYDYTPFIYKKNFTYFDNSPGIDNNVNFKITRHPILKNCTPNISLSSEEIFPGQKILNETADSLLASGSELIATLTINNKEIPFVAAYTSAAGSRSVAINSYLGTTSADTNFAKIIYNSIYWCLKRNT